MENRFIQAHNINLVDNLPNNFRNFQINKHSTKIEYKNSYFVTLPDQMTKDFLNFKGIEVPDSMQPEVRIIIGKKLIHTVKKLKKNENQKFVSLRRESIDNGSWNWKKATAIVSILPNFWFTCHIWDRVTQKKAEDISGFKIGFKHAFRILETLEISHAKHFKTSVAENQISKVGQCDFSIITYLKILKKQFNINFVLRNSFLPANDDYPAFEDERDLFLTNENENST